MFRRRTHSRWPGLISGTVLLCLVLAACDDPRRTPSEPLASAAADSPEEHAQKHQDPTYVCPMHPSVVSDEPGSCPICGMDLVMRRLEAGSPGRPEVRLDGAVVQTMGVRTAAVTRAPLARRVRTVGRVEYDETRIAHLHPRADGWIEGLNVRAEGERVSRGQALAELYAPDILAAQVDFLLALDRQGDRRSARQVDQARNLLRLLDVPDPVIQDIERARVARNTVPVLAPLSGIVTGIVAREGMHVTPMTEMFTIADLSRVWVMVDVFEQEIPWLETGLGTEVTVPAHPGRTWEGTVDYLYPELDATTRTLRVRLVFPNPDLELKPNMLADVVIQGRRREDVLTVPRDALIETGERTIVITALGDGRFRPVDVTTGMRADGRVEIVRGLDEDDTVVVSGQFLIDSESSLRAGFRRMASPGSEAAPGHDDR